jgi:hypothetical protein
VAFDAAERDRIFALYAAALDDTPTGRFQGWVNGSGFGFVHGLLELATECLMEYGFL